MDAETLMAIREQVFDCRQRRCLDQIDHDGSGEHGHSALILSHTSWYEPATVTTPPCWQG